MWRLVFASPPVCDAAGLQKLTLGQIADCHEMLDLRELAERKAMERREREAEKAPRR